MSERTPLDHARALIARGLSPIPVPYKSKRPTLRGWQSLRLTAADLPRHFNGARGNVGALLGELSGWIVDVDLDHARAVDLADSFLPHTNMVWGRDAKPRSHRLFRLTRPADTRKWVSKSAGMIVELRSSGCQTIAPGSVHPNGDPVRWYDDGEPAAIDPADLIVALEALAGAVRGELGEGPDTTGAPAPRPVSPAPRAASNYGREALRREAATVAAAPEGARNDALNRAAFNLGTLIAGGELDRADAESQLLAAARSCGLPDAEARRTIASGIASGMEHPRQRPTQAVTTTHGNRANRRDSVTVTPEPVPAFTPFPVDVLPEPVRSFVAQAARAIGCDASYVALPLLSALAAAIGNTHRIALKRGWPEPAIVWTAIVGESGTHKTPAFKLAMKATREAQDRAWKEYEAARAEWEAQHLRYEAELAAWKRDATKARGGDDGYTVAPPEKPTPPIARRYIVSDTTVEALAPILLGNPRGVLLARDELAGWLGSFDRYAKAGKAGADSAHWLSMHNGESMTVDRKTGIPPTIHVTSASVSIAGGVQPGILARALGQEHHESGLLARLLFAMPPRRVKRWTEADVNPDTEAAVAAVFDRLFSLTMEVDPKSPLLEPDYRPRLVRLAPDGKAAWVAFYNEHATEQAELAGDLSAAWSKLEGYAARLALVVHLTRWGAGDATLRDPARVDEASIAAGVVMARWFGSEARRVYAIMGESDEGRESRRLVELIQRKGTRDAHGLSMSGRQLVQASRMFPTVGDAEAALTLLVEAGAGSWVTPEQRGRGGPKARRFVLAPVYGVNVYRNATGGTGNANPVDVDGVDTATNAGDGWGEL